MALWYYVLIMLTLGSATSARGCPRGCTCAKGPDIITCVDLGYLPNFSARLRFHATQLTFINCTLINFHLHRDYWPSLESLTLISSTADCLWVNYARKWVLHVQTECPPPPSTTLSSADISIRGETPPLNATSQNTAKVTNTIPVDRVRQNVTTIAESKVVTAFQWLLLTLIIIQFTILFCIIVGLSVECYRDRKRCYTLSKHVKRERGSQPNTDVNSSLYANTLV